MGSGSPDWIAQVEIWDGSAWVKLRIGIKEEIKQKIVWESTTLGHIFHEKILSRLAIQCKSAYKKKYNVEPYWWLTAEDITIRLIQLPKDKVQDLAEKNSYSILEDDFGQFHFDLSPGVVT
ncbi:MAG: hypothetical protein WCI63_02245 [bacterium]